MSRQSEKLQGVREATRAYERWLEKRLRVVEVDLARKHQHMREELFPFLRATFYRWLQVWRGVCGDLADAPKVDAVGDLHVENFGTWRDAEGRLVWGVNDFDETYPLPFTQDLVRLTTSALLAADAGSLVIAQTTAATVVLDGYVDALRRGGAPFVLEEKHPALRRLAMGELREPSNFWEKLSALPNARNASKAGVAALKQEIPKGVEYSLVTRTAGLGSLGRERYVALVNYCGGMIAREAKALAPSAAVWAGYGEDDQIRYARVVGRVVRAQDPFVRVKDRWLVRRLAPHCTRIELAMLPRARDEKRMLRAMGWETGNVHLGSGNAKKLLSYLDRLDRGWLLRAARDMCGEVEKDWREYRAG
jgi:hypothetical protein